MNWTHHYQNRNCSALTACAAIVMALTWSLFAAGKDAPAPSRIGKVSNSRLPEKGNSTPVEDSDFLGKVAVGESEKISRAKVDFDQSPIDPAAGLVRDAFELRRMIEEDGETEVDFEIDAELVFYDAKSSRFRIRRSDGNAQARFFGSFRDVAEAPIQLGSLMRVRGHTSSGKLGHLIVESWKQIGDGQLPLATLLKSSDKASGQHLCGTYCQIRGTLSEFITDEEFCQLIVRNIGGLHVWQVRRRLGTPAMFLGAIGKRVRISGVLLPSFDERGERDGVLMHAMDQRQFSYALDDESKQEFHPIDGIVIAKDMENWLGVSDGQAVRWIHTYAADKIPLFAKVQTLCDRESLGEGGNTAHARSIQITGHKVDETVEVLSGSDLAIALHTPWPVNTVATVRSVFGRPKAYEVRMQADETHFIARIDRSSTTDSFRSLLDEGNILRLTGVRRHIPASHQSPATFKLIVNDPDSVKLVSKPIHLYARQIGIVGSVIASLFAVFAVWNYILRSKVRAKTQSIQEMAYRFQASCKATCEGMMYFDRNDLLVQASGCALKLLDDATQTTTPAELAGQKIAQQMVEPQAFLDQWRVAFGDRSEDVRQEYSLSESSEVLAFHSAPIYDAENQYDGRICTLRDVSGQRRFEHQVAQSQKQIAVGRLAGGIAHDFNNLLMVISANLTLTQQCVSDEQKVQHHTVIAQQAVERASELTRQLLDFSGRGELSMQIAHVNDCVANVGVLVEHMLDEKVELCLKMASDLAFTKIDSSKIEHLLLNLCLNARDSLDAADGHISVATCNEDHSELGPCVKIVVQDDGRGMDSETASRAFEPFFTTKEVGQGTGLGLAIAYQIVKQHGGAIQCGSTIGKGSHFEIFLPQTTESPEIKPPVKVAEIKRVRVKTESMRVMLVDDEPMIRDAGTALLTALGHETICAPDGQHALALLDEDSDFDVVLLDLTMPRLSGRETLKHIKQRFSHLRVVVCSGYSVDLESLGDDPASAPDAILAKPFSLDDIRRVLVSSQIHNV